MKLEERRHSLQRQRKIPVTSRFVPPDHDFKLIHCRARESRRQADGLAFRTQWTRRVHMVARLGILGLAPHRSNPSDAGRVRVADRRCRRINRGRRHRLSRRRERNRTKLESRGRPEPADGGRLPASDRIVGDLQATTLASCRMAACGPPRGELTSKLHNSTTMHTPSHDARPSSFGGALFIGTTPRFFGSISSCSWTYCRTAMARLRESRSSSAGTPPFA